VGSGRVHEGESSTNLCGRSCTKPAPLVRGSSRRITIMRFRPANIRVINRRYSSSTATRAASWRKKKDKTEFLVDRSFHIRLLTFGG